MNFTYAIIEKAMHTPVSQSLSHYLGSLIHPLSHFDVRSHFSSSWKWWLVFHINVWSIGYSLQHQKMLTDNSLLSVAECLAPCCSHNFWNIPICYFYFFFLFWRLTLLKMEIESMPHPCYLSKVPMSQWSFCYFIPWWVNVSLTTHYRKNTLFYSLSGNKGLCGVPSLPQCSLFWDNGRLSTGGKIAIGLSCLGFVCLLVLGYLICIRRRRHDYEFAPPHDLMCKYFSRMFKFFIF
jgi:hypothetical protein